MKEGDEGRYSAAIFRSAEGSRRKNLCGQSKQRTAHRSLLKDLIRRRTFFNFCLQKCCSSAEGSPFITDRETRDTRPVLCVVKQVKEICFDALKCMQISLK